MNLKTCNVCGIAVLIPLRANTTQDEKPLSLKGISIIDIYELSWLLSAARSDSRAIGSKSFSISKLGNFDLIRIANLIVSSVNGTAASISLDLPAERTNVDLVG